MKNKAKLAAIIGATSGALQPTVWKWLSASPIPMERSPALAEHIAISVFFMFVIGFFAGAICNLLISKPD